MFLLSNTLTLSAFSHIVCRAFICTMSMSGNEIICITKYYHLDGQLSYSLIYSQGEIGIILNRTKKKTFPPPPPPHAIFSSSSLIGGFFCGSSEDDTAVLFGRQIVGTMESPAAMLLETPGFAMVGLVPISVAIMKPLIWPLAGPDKSCPHWLNKNAHQMKEAATTAIMLLCEDYSPTGAVRNT